MYKLLLVALFATLATSCTKRKCYQCTVTVEQRIGNQWATGQSTFSACDLTSDEARKIEQQGTHITSGSGGTSETTTYCH